MSKTVKGAKFVFTDVTELYNKPKAQQILHQLINTPGLMDEFNVQLRNYKIEKIKNERNVNSVSTK